jgi:hypothetical protein
MSTVSIDTYAAGDTISAAGLNTDFTSIQTATAALDDLNTRTEWCSRRHIDEPNAAKTFNKDFNLIQNNVNTQVVVSTSFIQVALGATAFRYTPGTPIVLEPGQVLRAHFDVNVDDVEPDATFDDFVPENEDCYQFAFYYQDASLQVERIGCISSYSITEIPHHDPGTGLVASSATARQRYRQRCNLTLCHINTSGVNETFNYIEARVRVVDLNWIDSITLKEGTFTVFTGRY